MLPCVARVCVCVPLHQNKQKLLTMSLGGGFDAAMNAAVTSAWNNNIAVTVAAGNEISDACGVSPASAPAGQSCAARRYFVVKEGMVSHSCSCMCSDHGGLNDFDGCAVLVLQLRHLCGHLCPWL